jgi:hypothetical protein
LGGGDERMPQRVRPDVLGDPCAAGDAADDPAGTVPIQPPPVRGEEDRSFAALPDRQVDRPGGPGRQGDGDDLAALAGDDQGPVAAFQAQGLDVGAGGLGDAQAVEGEQGDQGMLAGRAEPGGDQQRAELVAVQAGGVRLIIQAGTADMGSRGMLQELLLDGVLIESGDRAQPAGDGRTSPTLRFEVAGEAFDVRAAGLE